VHAKRTHNFQHLRRLLNHVRGMISREETAAFLKRAEKFSLEWRAQAEFVRDTFLPQLEALNQQISCRAHIPDVSQEDLTEFMRLSATIPPYRPRLAHMQSGSNFSTRYHHAIYRQQIDVNNLMSVFFSNGETHIFPDAVNGLTLYFNNRYKHVMIGEPKDYPQTANSTGAAYQRSPYSCAWDHFDEPVRVYCNYDFYIEVMVKRMHFQELTWKRDEYGHNPEVYTVHTVPLAGVACTREQFTLSFVSLAAENAPGSLTLVDPSPAQLADFLKTRKRYIHPSIVLDYLRERPLTEISSFFGAVAQYDLAEAQNKAAMAQTELAKATEDVKKLHKAARADQDNLQAQQARIHEHERHAQQQLTKLNTAALRIKKLEIKLAQSERMYEELQMRLIEQEGLDGDDDLGGDQAGEDDTTVQTDVR
jgi:hypothetical protein